MPLDLSALTIRTTLALGDGEALVRLLFDIGWGSATDYQPERVEAMLLASTWFAVAEGRGQVLGYVRALSDEVSTTYLAEIAVAREFQRQGIGSALLEAAIARFGRTTAVYADAAPAVVGFLERYGLRPRPEFLVACARAASAT